MMKQKSASLQSKTIQNLFLIGALLVAYCGFPQTLEFKEVNIEMLEKNQSTIDNEAAAEVLYEKGLVTFILSDRGWKYQMQVTKRIKIYNKDGYDEANIEIPYYVGKRKVDSEDVMYIKASTYYLQDGKVKEEKIKKRDIFDVELNELVSAKKFTFPKVQDGVVLEYSYVEESPHIQNLPKWYFQSNIPIAYSEYETQVPIQFLAYRSQFRGYHQLLSENSELRLNIVGMNNGNYNKINQTKYYGYAFPAVESENHINNISNYISSIFFELSSYRVNANGDKKVLVSTWDDVANSLKKSDTYAKELERTSYFEDDLQQILEGKTTDLEKATEILAFVKKKVKWNKKYSRYCSNKLNKVYEEGMGNVADINIMLTAMLRHANLEANPVYLSTLSNGIPVFPTISGYNYIISRVKIDSAYHLLDASNLYSDFNLLPSRTMNWKGLEISSTGNAEIELITKNQSKTNFNVLAKLNEDGSLEGQCRVYYFDQFALNARNAFTETSEEKVIETYKKKLEVSNVYEFTQNNLEELNQPLVQTFKFEASNKYIEKIGEKLYLSPLLFLKSEDNPFKAKERSYPVDYTYPKKYIYRLILELPEGYNIDYIPESNIYKLDDLLEFKYVISQNSNKLMIDVTKDIYTHFVPPTLYTNLREYYISTLDKQNEKVVLVKS